MKRLTDEQLVDLFDEIVAEYNAANEGRKLYDPIVYSNRDKTGRFFAELTNRSTDEAGSWAWWFAGKNRVLYDPRCFEEIWVAFVDKHGQGIKERDIDNEPRGLATVRIAREYGKDAAMLYKLSDGAIDPRKGRDA